MTKAEKLKTWQIKRMRFIVLKVSGEWLGKDDNYEKVALMVIALLALGVQVAIVVGGGSLCRGVQFVKNGYSREDADWVGMKATEFVGMRLALEFRRHQSPAVVLSAAPTTGIKEMYDPDLCKKYMQQGITPIMVGGLNVPYTNTDGKAAFVAAGTGATLVMAKNGTDLVYNMDPNTNRDNPELKGYPEATFDTIISEQLTIMPAGAAETLKQGNAVAFVVDADIPNILAKLVAGERHGTILTAQPLVFEDDLVEA